MESAARLEGLPPRSLIFPNSVVALLGQRLLLLRVGGTIAGAWLSLRHIAQRRQIFIDVNTNLSGHSTVLLYLYST